MPSGARVSSSRRRGDWPRSRILGRHAPPLISNDDPGRLILIKARAKACAFIRETTRAFIRETKGGGMTKKRAGIEITRRSLMTGAAIAGSVPVLGLSVGPAIAKISQASVAYQDKPKGDQSCANCNLFESPSSCKTVDGTISADGWCRIWAKKRA